MDRTRQASNIGFAVGQAAVPVLGYANLLGTTVDSQVQNIKTGVVPADYTFVVWAFVFGASLVYAVEQARPSRREDPLFRRIGWLTAAAFAANFVWSLVAQLNQPLILTGLVFLVTFFAGMAATLITFAGPGPQGADRWKVGAAIGSLAGWVTVAIFANWSTILTEYGLGDVPDATTQALVLLSGAGATALVVLWRTRSALPYWLTLVWALAGLIVGNWQRGDLTVAIGAAVWLAIILAAGLWFRQGPGQTLQTAR